MTTYRSHSSLLPWTIAVASVLLAGAVVGLVLSSSSHRATSGNGGKGSSTTSIPPGGGGTVPSSSGSGFHVALASPTPGDKSAAPDTTVTVEMSDAVASDSPEPTISPAVTGTWTLSGPSAWTFQPTGGLTPDQTYTVTVPGGPKGAVDAAGQHMASPVKWSFRVQGSLERLQELLAELGYLPVKFVPESSAPVPPNQVGMAQPGSFVWRWPAPIQLTSLWLPDNYNVMITGAVMTFEDQHGLAVDGLTGPVVWSALIAAYARHDKDPAAYNFVWVKKTPLPEQLTLYSDGKQVFQTLVNTGVPGLETPDGTFTVFEHHPTVTMSGPGWVDYGVPWVSYFHDGDALHGYLRASYGTAQSLGCVEMPYDAASTVYPYTPIGTLVSIQ